MVSLSASVAWWARTEPDRTALVCGEVRLGYAQLHRRVEAAAGLMVSRGLRPGDVVALLMKNGAAFVELALAASWAGAVLLPINYRLSPDEVDYIARHAGARLMFVDESLGASARGCPDVVVLDDAAQADSSRLAGGAPPCRVPHPARPEDLYRLMYTSGTTDRPKGVIHTHANAMWKNLDHIAALGITREERLLIVGPLYHVGAFDLPGLAVLAMGGRVAILREFDAEAALALIERERLTGAWMAPVMLNRTLACEGRARFDLSSLRWIVGGGERTPEERIREFGELFSSARYVDAYGLTETCSGDTLMEAGSELRKIGSTGRALAHVAIEIRDDDGRVLPAGETGEICLRGPKVTRGYWKDPDRTAASFFGEWFRSGDVGRLDDEGFLYLTDRKKDMIISGGENIASSEVERVLYGLPQVLEAAVVGLPDARWGERVVAVVVPRPGTTLTMAMLREHCEPLLAAFKRPRELVLREALPRNPSGKVLKRLLRDELARAGTTG
jgi:fatty-acyl-CoA synthase